MDDYIKREDAIKTVLLFNALTDDEKEAEIRRIPSADVAPVRHGYWRLVSRLNEVEWLYAVVIECSQCKHEEVVHYNYCPNCGAKMDEENKDDE